MDLRNGTQMTKKVKKIVTIPVVLLEWWIFIPATKTATAFIPAGNMNFLDFKIHSEMLQPLRTPEAPKRNINPIPQ